MYLLADLNIFKEWFADEVLDQWLIRSLNVISNMPACRVVWCTVLDHSWRYQSRFLYRWDCIYPGKVNRICYGFGRCITVPFLWYNAGFTMGTPAAYRFPLQLLIAMVIGRKKYFGSTFCISTSTKKNPHCRKINVLLSIKKAIISHLWKYSEKLLLCHIILCVPKVLFLFIWHYISQSVENFMRKKYFHSNTCLMRFSIYHVTVSTQIFCSFCNQKSLSIYAFWHGKLKCWPYFKQTFINCL